MAVGEVHRVAVTRGSAPFQNQVSLPSRFSGTTRSHKPSSGCLLLPRCTSFPPFFFPLAGAALHSLSGKIEVYFFVSFCDSHLLLLSPETGGLKKKNNNKTKQEPQKLVQFS